MKAYQGVLAAEEALENSRSRIKVTVACYVISGFYSYILQ